MKLFGVTLSALVFSTLAFAVGGNERGGGVPPAPVFMPEAATYQCSVRLLQLNDTLQRPFASRAVFVAGWKKGEYAGLRGADLKDLAWKHYKLVPQGPFHILAEQEIPSAPIGASFFGYLRLHSPSPMPGGNDDLKDLEPGLPMELDVVASTVDAHAGTHTDAETRAYQTLQSRKSLHAKARLSTKGEHGDIKEQAELDVTCKRVE